MPNMGQLNSQFGNGPENLSGPVPVQPQVPMPKPPAAAPAPTQTTPPPSGGGSNPFAQFAPSKGAEPNPQPGPSAGPGDESNPFAQFIPAKKLPDETIMKGIFGQGEIRRKDGQVQIRIGEKFRDLSPAEYSLLHTAGRALEEGAEIGGGIAGGALAAPAAAAATVAGGPVGPALGIATEASGYGAGAAMGKKLAITVKHVLGIKDPNEREDSVEMMNAFLRGTAGSAFGLGAGKFMAGQAEQYGAKALGAEAAGAVAAKNIQIAKDAGIDLIAPQAGPDIGPGSAATAGQIQRAQDVGAGKLGPVSQMQLLKIGQENSDRINATWSKLKDQLAPASQQAVEQGIPVEKVFKPHEYLDEKIQQLRSNIAPYKQEAFNLTGDKQFDAGPVLRKFEEMIGSPLIKNGQIDKQLIDLSSESGRELAKQYLILRNMTSREAGAFAKQNRLRSAESPVYSAAGEPGSLTGPPGSSPDINMQQSGSTSLVDQNKGPDQFLGPNMSGDSSAGITFKQVDGLVDSLQDYWRYLKRKDDPMASRFGQVSHDAREMYLNILANDVAEKSPQTADMLLRYNNQYSNSIDLISGFEKRLSSNPNTAVSQIIRTDNPDEVKKLFHVIEQPAADQLRRAFLQKLEDDSTGNIPGHAFDAKMIKKSLSKYPEDTLNTVLGANREAIDGLVDTAINVQKLKLSPGEQPSAPVTKMLMHKFAAAGGEVKNWAIRLFRGNAPLEEWLASPDFQDQVDRYRRYQSASQNSAKVMGQMNRLNLPGIAGSLSGMEPSNEPTPAPGP